MKLIDVFPTWASGALFARLGEKYPDLFPWATSILDVEYFGNHSGNKTISTLVEKLLTAADIDAVDASTLETIVEVIKNRYAVTWEKLYAVMSAEYNPIENYSMVEEETPNITRTETPDITRTETPNITREETPDVTKTRNTTQKADVVVTSSGSSAADVFGFNSSEPVPQAETNGNTTQRTQGDAENNVTDETETETGKRTQTETGNRTETETGTRTQTETGNRKLTRSGNIGVTTSQQMLESEIALWQWNFYQTVYRDTDTVLTCPVYEL